MDAILVALATLLAALGGRPSQVTEQPVAHEAPGKDVDGKPIVFAATPDHSPRRGPHCGNRGDTELFTVAPDGSDLRRLTDNRLHESEPSWSPGHTHLVFTSRPDLHRDPTADNDLFVMRADGTDVRRVTDGPGQDGAPAWSPDGERIAFVRSFPRRPGVSSSNDKRALMVVRADGSALRRLSRPRRYVGAPTPAWSPDGSRVAFPRDRYPGPVSLLRVAIPGERGRAVLRDGRAQLSSPDWSPDGRWILYASFRTRRMVSRLERVRADGSRRRVVLSEDWAAEPRSPAWSPRGDRIAYVGTMMSCLPHVYRMSADGGRSRHLLKGEHLEVYSLDW